MSNVTLGFPNIADLATLSSGTWSGTLPLANLQNKLIGKIARSSSLSTSSTKFDITYTEPKLVKLIALINHNLSLDATYRIRASNDSGFSTLLLDTDWLDVWESFWPTSILAWEDENWFFGKPKLSDVTGYTWNLTHILSESVKARYWRIELNDSTNAAGYVQLGRLFMSELFSPIVNMDYGVTINYETTTTVEQNKYSGIEFFNSAPGFRVSRFQLSHLNAAEAIGKLLMMQRVLGLHGEVFFIHDRDDLQFLTQRGFLGRLRNLNPIDHPYYDNYSTAFEIKELI
jgi:hypothetical protein